MSIRNVRSTILFQDAAWANFLGVKLIKPKKPIDRILKNNGKKTIDQHIMDKSCASCFKKVNILDMTADNIRIWGDSGICCYCQDKYSLEN